MKSDEDIRNWEIILAILLCTTNTFQSDFVQNTLFIPGLVSVRV